MVAFALFALISLRLLVALVAASLYNIIIITYFYNYHYNYLHLIPLLTLSHRGCEYFAGEQHFNISCFKQTRRWSPFYLLHCVFLCLCACFAERCKQAVGGRLQAQYSSRESGVEALVAAPQVVRRHTLNHKQLVVDAQYAVSLFATLLWQILHP